jgi:hypothetical protein
MRGDPIIVNGNSRSTDAAMAARLWTESEQLVGLSFGFR